jgi:acetyl esterase
MPYVRPDVADVLAMFAEKPRAKPSEVSVADFRANLAALIPMLERPRGKIATVDLKIPGSASIIPARLYVPDDAGNAVVAFFHGGGFIAGDLDTHDPLCAEISRLLGLRVVSVDYRLAPEATFPAASEDCIAAMRWLASSPTELGGAVTGIIPAGDSAGGTLAAVVTRELHGLLPAPILAQWLIYPGTDMTATEGSFVEFGDGYSTASATVKHYLAQYMKGSEDKLLNPWASPLYAETLAGLPPSLVFTSGLDVLRDQGRAYAARLIEHGVRTIYREAEGQIHSCLCMRKAIPSAQTDLIACINDLKRLLADA